MFTEAIYDVLANDGNLSAMLAEYRGLPAIFTTDPPPGDAKMPYIVTAGEVSVAPWDTKDCIGLSVIRDIRVYAPVTGSAIVVEAIAWRVRMLLHRVQLPVDGYRVLVSDVTGPVAADQSDAYGRVVSVNIIVQEE